MRLSIAVGLAALARATCDSQNPTAPPPVPAPATAPGPAAQPEPPRRPDPPTNVRVTESGPDFLLWEWDAVEGAVGYHVRGCCPWTETEVIAETRWRHEGLQPDSEYRFQVASLDRHGSTSLWEGIINYARTEPAPEPEPAPSPSVPLYMGEPGEPRVCTDERERALAYADIWGRGDGYQALPYNWDGTPFTVNLFDHFPAIAGETYLEDQLDMVAELAALIEEQIGYPIIEAGSVIPVPEGLPDGWNSDSFPGCERWREPGTVVGAHLDALPDRHRGGGALAAEVNCAMIHYWVGDGVPPPPWPNLRIFKTAVVHDLFHLFGYKHSPAHQEPHQGVAMSPELWSDASGGHWHAVTFEDIDALRCIFPLP